MVSTVDRSVRGVSWSGFSGARDLQRRLLFTLGALLVYRFGAYVPVPGVDPAALSATFQGKGAGLLRLFDVFSGGAVGRMAVFALGIVPYISASIIVQLLTVLVPRLAKLKKEGTHGRRTLNQCTRYLTVVLSVFQGYGVAVTLELARGLVQNPGLLFEASTTLTLVGGTVFLTWLGDQITSRGISNGTSLIIFSGIVAQFPPSIVSVLELGRQGILSGYVMFAFFLVVLTVILLVVFIERSQRRLLVQYPKRYAAPSPPGHSHVPVKVNVSGVIPPVFASSLLMIPATFSHIFPTGDGGGGWFFQAFSYLARGNFLYLFVYALGIAFFSFFYAPIVFDPDDVAENIKKGGGFIPGIRPGRMTAEYLERVLMRLTVLGSVYLVGVCLVPEVLISNYGLPVAFGGTSLLIAVSVMMDVIVQVQSHMLAHQYEGLIRKVKIKRSKR